MMSDLYSLSPEKIVLYGVSWCPDCRRSRAVLANANVVYRDVDIDEDAQADAFVKQVNRGNRSVPTIIFPDGSTLTEPSDPALREKLKSLS